MTLTSLKLLVLISLLLIAAAAASARTSTFEVTRGTQKYFGTVSYDVEKAYAGTHTLEVTLSISTRDTTNLELIKLEAPEQTKIQFRESSRSPSSDPATGLQTTEYRYLAEIPDDIDPRIYLITLVLSYPGDKNTNQSFDLYVGVRSKGKLNIVSDAGSITQLYSGITNPYSIELVNNFTDYPVNIRSVSVKSEPLGLIESQTLQIQDMSIETRQHATIDLPLKAAPMSFTNLLSGFSDSSQLILHVNYDDSYGRPVTDLTYPVKIKVRPRDRVLIVAMLIGVIIGAILKCYLQRLQQQGIISRREAVIAIGITSLIGLVVSFIAVVGRIKIIAFDQMGSYDNPAVIFVISLAGAVGGAQLLSTFFKMGSSSSSSAPATTTTTSAPAAKPVS